MENVDFNNCPMYIEAHKNKEDISALHKGHRGIIKQLKKMDKINRKKDKYLVHHMDTEEAHHEMVAKSIIETNEAVISMSSEIKTLMKDKKSRDIVKDKREGIKEKVLVALSILVIVGAYNLFMDLMLMKQAVGVE